jgi:hypothetical protein
MARPITTGDGRLNWSQESSAVMKLWWMECCGIIGFEADDDDIGTNGGIELYVYFQFGRFDHS